MKKKIYLDYAATTPVDPRVVKTMMPFLSDEFGNSMSLHTMGQKAKIALENSRKTVADFINASSNEIIFTGSATESNNTVLKGLALAMPKTSRARHMIISSIEHPCIAETAEWLEKETCLPADRGWKITKLPVDKYGMVNPEDVKNAIKPETILVSVIHASNEIGTIQKISEIGKICRENNVYFHTDASQSFGKVAIDVKKMNIDLLTASSHKIYGPKGVGLLYVRQGIRLMPLLHGGGQENGLRGSTVNVPAVVGFAEAVEIYKQEAKKENAKLIKLRDQLIKGLLKINGSHLNGHPTQRLSNNVNVWFEFVEGESLIIQLDMHGVECSTGSACSSLSLEPSPVLLATGLKPQEAHGSLRISLGRYTKESDIKYLIKILPGIIKKIREISPFK
ncbi:MAG: cysteine desulfurase family protein [Candidatus Staskawiczbacteria bacterium]|nr:cysteine desulfurase family protein [Candidatus Staskawiczbacteria bacterium]